MTDAGAVDGKAPGETVNLAAHAQSGSSPDGSTFYTLNAIRWRDIDRRRLVDMVTLLVEQHKRKGST